MPKVCVFCGRPPKGKNKEHVIPKWLIALTGESKRKVYLGRKWAHPELEKRIYPLNSFTFPACEGVQRKVLPVGVQSECSDAVAPCSAPGFGWGPGCAPGLV